MRMLFLLVAIVTLSCQQESNNQNVVQTSDKMLKPTEVSLEIYDYEGLKPFLETDSDSVYVVNFWATWCAPCVKELPHFEALNQKYANKNVEVILVSLDFPKKYDSHVKPFIVENNLQSRVMALDDTNSNSWIPEIDPNWSGAIPATLIFNKSERKFYEQTFTYEALESELVQFFQ